MVRNLFIALMVILQMWISANSQEPLHTFSNLSKDEKVVIKYRTAGCFHFFSGEFEIKGNSPIKVKAWNLKSKSFDVERKYIGEKYLSDAELYKLDKLLSFYRKSPKGGCTTQDHIEFTWYKKNKEVFQENITDGSCQVYQLDNVLPLEELVDRIQNKK